MSKWAYIILLTFLVWGCKTKQGVELEKKSGTDLKECLDKSRIQPEWFSAKIATDLTAKGEKNSFKISLRIRKDSVIWANISKGPIVIATSIITKDSVKGVIKVGGCRYFEKDFDFIRRQFGPDLSFDMLQDLFLGNPVGFDPDEKYKQLKDSSTYVLSTHSQRQIDKAYEKLPRNEEKQYIQRYWMRPDDCKNVRTLINHLRDTSNIDIQYLNFKKEDDWVVPNKVLMIGDTPGDTVRLELNYSRHKIDKPLKFTYKVNPKCVKIDPENL